MAELIFSLVKNKSDAQLNEIYNFNAKAFADSQNFLWTRENIENELTDGWSIFSVNIEKDIICALFVKEQKKLLSPTKREEKMNKIIMLYQKTEKILSSMKFAVFIITIFALILAYGTFMESFHGTDYAGRAVYKSWWFMAVEFLMFMSIFMAVVVRLPPKKRLYGFYTIPAGLILLFIGSLFTYISGIDGSIQIIPNTPAKKILIAEDFLKITFPEQKKSFKLALPYTAHATNINKTIQGIEIKEFLPFANIETIWKKVQHFNPQIHSAQYQIFNQNVSQNFVMSLDPNSDFKSTTTMGLLAIHYMPKILENCLIKKTKSNLIIWNLQTADCFTPEERKIKIEKTPEGSRFLILPFQKKTYKFFPDFSPVAVTNDLKKDLSSPFRVLARNLFEKKPNLFLFGNKLAFFNKRKKSWKLKSLDNGIITLPWMGFKLRLLKHSSVETPAAIPIYAKPIQENSKIISGMTKAVSILYQGREFWIRNDGPLEITNGIERIQLEIVPREINLPYQITLSRFQMNRDPGTNNPASYESYIQLLDGRTTKGVQNYHVYMNNPLKYDDFTFYQSSYFPIGANEQYGSVLSVNYDPGLFLRAEDYKT